MFILFNVYELNTQWLSYWKSVSVSTCGISAFKNTKTFAWKVAQELRDFLTKLHEQEFSTTMDNLVILQKLS